MINALVYDIEIIKAIPSKHEERLEGILYCDGWHDHANMGVSVIGAYDFVESRYRVFCQDNFKEFFELCANRDTLIGFNTIGFDNKVLRYLRCCKATLDDLSKQYDILDQVYQSAGHRFKGSGLDSLCNLNDIGSKSGNGALAPVQWQRGEYGSVIDYCLQDTKLTRDLFVLCQKESIATTRGALKLRKILEDQVLVLDRE